MKRVVGVSLLFAAFCAFRAAAVDEQAQLRVMSFNIWLSGASVRDGLYKIAKHIRLVDPDIVAIQELETPEVFVELLDLLGPGWTGLFRVDFAGVNQMLNLPNNYPDDAIITRHRLIPNTTIHFPSGVGVEVVVDGKRPIRFVSQHLDWRSYGPYAAYNKLVTNISQILAGETLPKNYNRAKNVASMLADETFGRWMRESKTVPLIVAGDFNCPSHLDWGEDSRHVHGGWVVEWPATKLMNDSGFSDTFRVANPDRALSPGLSWSTVNKSPADWAYTIPEPQDRIDFIFLHVDSPLTVVDSFLYSGTEPLRPIPFHGDNDYPSDHFAMITDFINGADLMYSFAK